MKINTIVKRKAELQRGCPGLHTYATVAHVLFNRYWVEQKSG